MDAHIGVHPRFRAFISYSHRNAAFGRRLHRRLEAYALPRRLVGRPTPLGPAPARLAPIFRDREELSAAGDLTEQVRAALAQSAALIVVCSPAAKASPWVAREIELFRALHPDRPVLAALIAGEPHEAFPDTLRTPAPNGALVEPLAADFRHDADGARPALLKLVAGVLGIGLDELIQRDAQRNLRRVTTVTAGALAIAVAMGVTATLALEARADAERQRSEAEGLTDFMQTDLREYLRGVGRLEVMSAVNRRALKYYDDQGLDRLPRAARARRARLLLGMGEDDFTAGDKAAALKKFREAEHTTSALLAAAPNDPERMLDQGQSEFWLGWIDYHDGRRAEADAHFRTYKRLADRLVAMAPRNPRYLREAAYAEGNLCSIALGKPQNLVDAMRACSTALDEMQRAAAQPGAPRGIELDLANRHAWLADVYRDTGDGARALEQRQAQAVILERLIAKDPKNMMLREKWVALQRAFAALALDAGRYGEARLRLAGARDRLDTMIAFDPSNHAWSATRAKVESDLSYAASGRVRTTAPLSQAR